MVNDLLWWLMVGFIIISFSFPRVVSDCWSQPLFTKSFNFIPYQSLSILINQSYTHMYTHTLHHHYDAGPYTDVLSLVGWLTCGHWVYGVPSIDWHTTSHPPKSQPSYARPVAVGYDPRRWKHFTIFYINQDPIWGFLKIVNSQKWMVYYKWIILDDVGSFISRNHHIPKECCSLPRARIRSFGLRGSVDHRCIDYELWLTGTSQVKRTLTISSPCQATIIHHSSPTSTIITHQKPSESKINGWLTISNRHWTIIFH